MMNATQHWCTKYNDPYEISSDRTVQHFARMWYDLLVDSPGFLILSKVNPIHTYGQPDKVVDRAWAASDTLITVPRHHSKNYLELHRVSCIISMKENRSALSIEIC
jgi:hypothetical protein